MRRLAGVMAAILVGVGIMGITPALGSSTRQKNDIPKNDCTHRLPEPSTMLLLGSGLAGLVWYGIRGKKK